MRSFTEANWSRFPAAAIAVAIAFLVRLALHPILGNHVPYLVFTVAIAFSAWYGGFLPALLATAASAVLAILFFISPSGPVGLGAPFDTANLLTFLLSGAAISALGAEVHMGYRRATENASQANLHLEAAVRSEQRLADILASAMDAIISVNSEQRIVLFNAAAERMFGLASDEIRGQSLDRLIPERYRDAHRVHVGRFGETGVTSRTMGRLGTLYALRADGTEFPIEATISRTESDGQPLYTVFIRDVTDRESAERELRRRAEELDQSNRAKDNFLAMLGHELRNPLAPMLNALELMRMRPHDAVTADRARTIMERQARHMARLVDDLLDVSRITRGKIELRRERIDVCAAVIHAIQTITPVMEQHGHQLECHYPEATLIVEADPARLEQVFQNLLNNAAKYTMNGGRILVEVGQENETATVRVRDTGIGISPELLPRIFDLFTQADRSLDRSLGGLGIGLTLVKSLVELHGGTVKARSEGLGHGSEFTVRLPLSNWAAPVENGTGADSESRRPLRIAVVDDNVDAAQMLEDVLTTLGHEVHVYHDGPSALRGNEAFQPDVVLLDIGLPGMDGYEVARRLRRRPEASSVRLVAVTGYGQEEDRRRSVEAGFDAHLVKPVDMNTLTRVLADA